MADDLTSQGTSRGAAIGAALLGAGLGAAFYFGVARVALPMLFADLWISRVMSSIVNLFSFMAFGAACLLLLGRWMWIASQQRAFGLDLIAGDEDALLLPEDALECRRRLRDLKDADRRSLLVRLLDAALQRARANWSAEDVSEAVRTQVDLMQGQTDSQYALIRYLAWAIAPIGFVGTVLGIGEAMGALNLKGSDSNWMQVAAGHLHTAFDTTLVALVLSIVLMFFFYRIQAQDDALIVRSGDWCLRRFVYRMHISKEPRS